MNSFNHYAYGAIGDWIYKVIAGINVDPIIPGYKRIVIKPRPGGGITHAKGALKSIYGEISVEWSIEDLYIIVCVVVPHNTKACIILPKASPEQLKESGIVFVKCDGGCEGMVGSGQYVFKYMYE